LAYESGLALVRLNGAPILVMDLESGENRLDLVKTTAAPDTLTGFDPDQRPRERPPRTTDLPALSVIRPIREGQDAAEFLSSPQFALVLEDAKRSFNRVVVAADCVLDSVGAVVAASLCDGVVLLVKEDIATATVFRDIQRSLRRCDAKLLGFLYEKS
jgi:hypothetical protein